MIGCIRNRVGRLLAGGVAALLLSAGAASAQTPDEIQQLKAQFERQQRQLDELRAREAATVTAEGGGLGSKDVEKIVGEYLKRQDADKKKKDEEKKQADDAKKKADDAKGAAVGSDLKMSGSWNNGLEFKSSDGAFKVHVGGRLNADWGWYAPDAALEPRGFDDGANMRRARLRVDGSCWEVISWVCEVDFINGVAGTTNHPLLTDCYFDVNKMPWLGNFRVGHMKEPFGLDYYGSANYISFMERGAAVDAFEPQRNMGMMLYNTWAEDRVFWGGGFFRSNSDNNSGNVFDAGEGEYALTTRLSFLPWYENDGRCMALIGGGYSKRWLDPDDATSRATFQSRIPLRAGNSPNVVSTGAMRADNLDLYNAQALLIYGPFSVQGEYYYANLHNLRRGTAAPGVTRLLEPAFDGWYVQASYFLTGENRGFRKTAHIIDRVKVNEPFFWVERGTDGGSIFGRGAWEVALRYDRLDVGSPALGAFGAIPGVAGSAVGQVTTRGRYEDVVVGLNWYLNNNFKIMANYIWGRVDGTDASPMTQTGDVHAFGMRFHWDF